jgi:hypothetical protein
MDKEFFVCTYTLGKDLGTIFMQEGGSIAYASCKLKGCEINYSTYDLDLAIDVMAINLWKHYLMG